MRLWPDELNNITWALRITANAVWLDQKIMNYERNAKQINM